jgi:phage tail tube protein FII
MAATIFNMDSANLFVGDDDPTNSQFLVLRNIKFPSLEEATKDHDGGGAVGTLTMGMRKLEALSLPFQLEGFNPSVMNKFMPITGRTKYTIRGNMRDIRDHTDKEIRAVIEGRMTRAEMSEFSKDDGINTDYEIREIVFYELFADGDEKFYYDYFSGPKGVRVDGQEIFPVVARNLGLA